MGNIDTGYSSLTEYKESVEKDVKNLVRKKGKEKQERDYIKHSSYAISRIKEEICLLFNNKYDLTGDTKKINISLPPKHIHADLTVSVFDYSKTLRKSPALLARELADFINTSQKKYIESVSANNGYINILINKKEFYSQILSSVLRLGDKYGFSDVYKGKTVLIDYSSPNIAKPFGIGHLRSTVIGQALANLYYAVGYSVIRDNHLGDWGTQFGALIYAYTHWGDEAVIAANPIEELKNLYVRFTEEAREQPALKEEARKLFSQLEQGDEGLVILWKKFRELSLQEFQKTYDRLNVSFDCMLGESFYTEDFNKVIRDLKEKGIAKDSEDGAVIVENLDNLPSFLLQKNDGSTIYILRDVITVMYRKRVFNPDVVLYVVGSEQKLNFQQLFALCKKAGYSGDIKMEHVDFGLVLIGGVKMSTRKGTLVNLDEVLKQVIAKARDLLLEKGELDVSVLNKTSDTIGISSVIYADLKQNRNSNIEFDWQKMLSLESGSSVYLQYTYARIASILTKTNVALPFKKIDPIYFVQDALEFKLAVRLSLFPETVLHSVENNTPHFISAYLEELAAEFNNFYTQVSILKTADSALQKSRIALIAAVATTIRNGLSLLNIPTLSRL
ncbi:MAG: arginine--tRNA ligase [Patescibacteria group bacterium]